MKNIISKKTVIFISIAIMALASISLFAQYGRGYGDGYGRGAHHGYGRGYGCDYGYGRGHGMRGGCGYGYGRGYGYYNNVLTQEQISQIQAIRDKYFPQMDELRREIYNQSQIINAEMYKENPDQTVINTAIDARTKARADLYKLRTQCFIETDKVYKNK